MNRPVDWKAFEYKFSTDSRPAFESLAYILFCYEFKQTYGIFRYYNQPYIETQPANTADGHKVGFQAKYYDAGTQMSSKEQDLKDAIKGAKNKYAGIDRIIFYINKEFSASSAKDKDKPEHQIRIEKYGKNLGIEIQWRGQSHIEKMLAEEELKYVKNLYFNAKDGIDRFHENLINHKNSILKHIHSTIQFTGKEVKIPQDYQKLTDFQESDTQVMIIHGAAGAGKSAIVKDFLEADHLGSVVILEKAPIVSKNLESDKYENEKVKAAAEQFKSAEEGTAVSDIFAAAGEGTTVKDQNGEDVDISQYKTCGSLVEVAMKLGDEYFTNAECQFEGTVQMDLEQVDYKALLKSAGIDENTSDEDLLNVEEFEAPDYVLAQLNAVSGEASVSTGLKFGFEKVEGSDRPVLVIKGTFNGLGAVALASKAE